jgi:Sec1 family
MFDRDVDIISPFCYNQTYEGLIDEYFGIKTCSISVENKILHPDEKVREELKVSEDGS